MCVLSKVTPLPRLSKGNFITGSIPYQISQTTKCAAQPAARHQMKTANNASDGAASQFEVLCRFRLRDRMRELMIDAEGLTKTYGSLAAVSDLSFRVESGEVLGLVGPNGAGKTTTLRCLVGVIPPTRGEIRICGYSLSREPLAAKRNIAFLPDEPRLFDYLTVKEHLQFTARIYGVHDFQMPADVLLAELELREKADALPAELSRGMKQKLVIACGLLHSPKVLLFDEPLTGLDPIGIRRMKSTILKRAREGAAIIISSHLLHLVEELCDRVLILNQGRKIIHGSLEEIQRSLPELRGDTSLEEMFLRITGHAEDGTEMK
jgi:ABC-2 type transport system ATP-binding protein